MDPFVKAAQKKLIAKGYDVGRTGADGDAGDATRAAILKYQTDKGLPATETLTQETWQSLDDAGERAAEITVLRAPATPQSPDWNDLPTLPPIFPRQENVETFYGKPDLVRKVHPNAVMLNLPFSMKIAWALEQSVTRIAIHEKCHDSAKRVFERIADAYTPEQRAEIGIDIFGGSVNVRTMRGGTKLSMHAYACAIDFDPIRNQLKWTKDRARLAKPDAVRFWELWEEEGWLSLGRARDFDWMHIQAARL